MVFALPEEQCLPLMEDPRAQPHLGPTGVNDGPRHMFRSFR